MPSKTVQVNSYEVTVSYKSAADWDNVTIQFQGLLACFGFEHPPTPGVPIPNPTRLLVYGLHPSSPVPPRPVYNTVADVGAIFVPFNDLHNYVDIVRNHRPVYAYLDSANPASMSLRTMQEAVGEGV
jgi:hypothetical protein